MRNLPKQRKFKSDEDLIIAINKIRSTRVANTLREAVILSKSTEILSLWQAMYYKYKHKKYNEGYNAGIERAIELCNTAMRDKLNSPAERMRFYVAVEQELKKEIMDL